MGSHDGRKWLITMVHGDRFRPLNGVVGPLPNGLFMAYKWGLLTTYIHWDDPPSKHNPVEEHAKKMRFFDRFFLVQGSL